MVNILIVQKLYYPGVQTRAAMDVGFLHPDILNVKQTDNCRINTAPPTKFS